MTDPQMPVSVRREGAIQWITLNRPEKRNALSAEMVDALKLAFATADADPEVRVIALTGAGKDFCAGADLDELDRLRDASPLDHLEDAGAQAELFLMPRRLRRPVVAVVRGRALAGGCGLATACDLVIAGDSARFGYPETALGFVPAMVMALLRRQVNEKKAFELIALGESLTAVEAQRIGLVNRVFPDAELLASAEALLSALAARSASALMLCKRLLHQQDGLGLDAAIQAGAEVNVIARMTDDAREGIARFARRDGAGS